MNLRTTLFLICSFFLLCCSKGNSEEELTEETTVFLHPGVINDKINLDRIRKSTLSAEQQSTYSQLLAFIKDNPVKDSYPKIVYIQGEIGGTTSTPTASHMRMDA